MKTKALAVVTSALLSMSMLGGCSYFPARMTVLPTSENTLSVTQSENQGQSQTETAPTETTVPNPAEEAVREYEDFIQGKNKVSTEGCFEKDGGKAYFDLVYGSYSLDDLKKAVRFDPASGSRARYCVLGCGDNGISELAICLDRLNGSDASVICLIGYQDKNLIMNAIIEEKATDEYRLYDGGHLKSDTVSSDGVNKRVLINIDDGGKLSEVFTYNEYKGSTAAAVIKHLSKSEEESSEGFEMISADFLLREYIADGKITISVGRWSESEDQKSLEEKFVSKLKSLGAEEIAEEKMQELSSAKEYTAKEVTWNDCTGEGATPSSVGIADVAGRFSISIYPDPENPDYIALGNVVNVLCSGNGTDMRFVCDSDDVTLIFEKGSWDMNTDTFAPEKELFNIKSKVGTVYQFNCVLGGVFPYYRLRASKGNYSAEWLALKGKDGSVIVIKSSMN